MKRLTLITLMCICVILGMTGCGKSKKEFDNGIENEDLKYEVSLNYDSKGYINKVIITNY